MRIEIRSPKDYKKTNRLCILFCAMYKMNSEQAKEIDENRQINGIYLKKK